MKIQKLLCVLLVCFLPARVMRAADPVPAVRHWYTAVVNTGTNVDTFTGSSPLDAEDFARTVTADAKPVRLENLRAFYRMDDKSGWHEDKRMSTLFIVPRSIIYFYELSEEPKLIEK